MLYFYFVFKHKLSHPLVLTFYFKHFIPLSVLTWRKLVPHLLLYSRPCRETTSSCPSFLFLLILLFPLEALPSHPPSPFIRYSPPHLLSLSIPLLSTGICLGISRWKLHSISGAPYQHTIIMGNDAEQHWIQLGLPLWWHYWLQGPASAGSRLHLQLTSAHYSFTSFSPPSRTLILKYGLRNE